MLVSVADARDYGLDSQQKKRERMQGVESELELFARGITRPLLGGGGGGFTVTG